MNEVLWNLDFDSNESYNYIIKQLISNKIDLIGFGKLNKNILKEIGIQVKNDYILYIKKLLEF